VRNTIEEYGCNAGKIWEALNQKGPLTKKKIIELTNLNDKDFFVGLGWLARENKVSKEKRNKYKLDKTNLTGEIGKIAGRIWKIIDIWEEVDMSSIKKLSDAEEEQIYSGIGWLAREDKINLTDDQKYRLK